MNLLYLNQASSVKILHVESTYISIFIQGVPPSSDRWWNRRIFNPFFQQKNLKKFTLFGQELIWNFGICKPEIVRPGNNGSTQSKIERKRS